MSYWEMAKVGYQELVNAIIRPPRAEYLPEQLGPTEFTFGGHQFTRTDFELTNERGMKIQCSHWEPVERKAVTLPCVIYMHGNASARPEALSQLALCLSLGATMVAFDFCGSGLSEGDWVSLGYFEREDLKVVVEHLRASDSVSTIALWGRSMGAATALLHGDRDPSIAAMVLDSPFADLNQLAEEMVDKGRQQGLTVPGFVVGIAIRMIRSSVQKQAGFNVRDLSPAAHADRCFIPALFVAGEDDDFIAPHHAQQIHDKYAGDKNFVKVAGDHNSSRPRFLYDSAAIFLQTCLQIPDGWALTGVDAYNHGSPPWYSSALDMYRGMDLGMTRQRQMETQQAVYGMLSGGTFQDPRNSGAPAVGPAPTGPGTPWACVVCTLVNGPTAAFCAACRNPAP